MSELRDARAQYTMNARQMNIQLTGKRRRRPIKITTHIELYNDKNDDDDDDGPQKSK